MPTGGLKLQTRVSGFVFDRGRALVKAVDRGKLRMLFRFGSLVRTVARRSIRSRRGASAPGKPPSSHTDTLKRLIYFKVEPSSDNVVVGPLLFKSKSESKPVSDTVPAIIETGGQTVRQLGKRRLIERRAARPFMGPAHQTGQKELPDMLANSIK